MPDGHRRGGSYTRNGKTFYRRGTSIAPPKPLLGAAVGVVAFTAFTGGAFVGSSFWIGAAVVVGVGYVIYRNRRRLAPAGKRLARWADKKATKAGRKKPPKGQKPPKPDGSYLDQYLRPHYADGKFMPVEEWKRRRPADAKWVKGQ